MTLKQINDELAGRGFQIEASSNDKGMAKPVVVKNEDGDFLFRAKNTVEALIQIGVCLERGLTPGVRRTEAHAS